MSPGQPAVRLGLGANWRQFGLLVAVNGFVGALVGVERSVLPVLAESDFGVTSARVVLSFLLAFGIAKAVANLVAGDLAGRLGRKRVLVAGWLVGLPVPLLLMTAPTWGWVLAANLLLGVNQGLAWSATVIMKIDLVGPRRRGLAVGMNEFAGYLAVGLTALFAGYLAAAYGPRPAPFVIALIAAVLGLSISAWAIQDTGDHVRLEQDLSDTALEGGPGGLSGRIGSGLLRYTWGNRGLVGANQAGLVNNLNDGLVWGLVPLYLSDRGLGPEMVAWVAGVYPAVWGGVQLATGALSDRWGRRLLIVGGLLVQAASLAWFAGTSTLGGWIGAAVALGVGTAAVYPTLIAQVSDLVGPADRAGALGVYRFWRDGGYVAGALVAGWVADRLGYTAAIQVVAVLTLVSGVGALILLPARRGRGGGGGG